MVAKLGYRLDIVTVGKEKSLCCGKLYGYVEDEAQLLSYQWLKDNGYMEGDEVFTYGYEGNIVLWGYDLKKFLALYKEDLKKFYFFNLQKRLDEIDGFVIEDYEKYVLCWG